MEADVLIFIGNFKLFSLFFTIVTCISCCRFTGWRAEKRNISLLKWKFLNYMVTLNMWDFFKHWNFSLVKLIITNYCFFCILNYLCLSEIECFIFFSNFKFFSFFLWQLFYCWGGKMERGISHYEYFIAEKMFKGSFLSWMVTLEVVRETS